MWPPQHARTNILPRAAKPVRVLELAGLLAGLPHMVYMQVIARLQNLARCSITCMIRHYAEPGGLG
jgi:hypothetical protein